MKFELLTKLKNKSIIYDDIFDLVTKSGDAE